MELASLSNLSWNNPNPDQSEEWIHGSDFSMCDPRANQHKKHCLFVSVLKKKLEISSNALNSIQEFIVFPVNYCTPIVKTNLNLCKHGTNTLVQESDWTVELCSVIVIKSSRLQNKSNTDGKWKCLSYGMEITHVVLGHNEREPSYELSNLRYSASLSSPPFSGRTKTLQLKSVPGWRPSTAKSEKQKIFLLFQQLVSAGQ